MPDILLSNADFFTWVVMPLLIFIARVADVSLGTVRVIFVARGHGLMDVRMPSQNAVNGALSTLSISTVPS